MLDFLILKENIKSISSNILFFSQAWEKCSVLTREEAMREYIKLYNFMSGENEELPEINSQTAENKEIVIDFDMDIPEDFEGSNLHSSSAKQTQQEIKDYLDNIPEKEQKFHKLKESIYNGDVIYKQTLEDFSVENEINCKN